MSDYTMCTGFGCPMADICARTKMTPGQRQSWFVAPPVIVGSREKPSCEYLMPLEGHKARS